MDQVDFIEHLSKLVKNMQDAEYSNAIQEYLELNQDRISETVMNTMDLRGKSLADSEVEVLFEIIEKLYENFNALLTLSAKNLINSTNAQANVHEAIADYLKTERLKS
jgi:hypothetical protein